MVPPLSISGRATLSSATNTRRKKYYFMVEATGVTQKLAYFVSVAEKCPSHFFRNMKIDTNVSNHTRASFARDSSSALDPGCLLIPANFNHEAKRKIYVLVRFEMTLRVSISSF